MPLRDHRDLAITAATPEARDSYERALGLHLSWRSGASAQLDLSLQAAPDFVMAHVLRAYLHLGSRDRRRVQLAQVCHLQAAGLRHNEREALHVRAIGAGLADDFATLSATLREINRRYPRDVLALQIGHAVDYLTGDLETMGERVAALLPHWSASVPGYHAVLAMHAFSLVENADYGQAEQQGERSLELDPGDARAHHALAHLYEMSGRTEAGLRWLQSGRPAWALGTVAATHLWWHSAVFHLSRQEPRLALDIYDRHVRHGKSAELADLIDASALLWRVALAGGDVGHRWSELATAWQPYLDDAYCSFSDVHAMLALVGAGRWELAGKLEQHMRAHARLATRYGTTSRLVGAPAGSAILAYGRGEHGRAVELLSVLPATARHLGGSHAQRDVLYLTLLDAIDRLRRPRHSLAA